ncbi:MAG TPA: ATP-binding protein [Polyangiales bacterium]
MKLARRLSFAISLGILLVLGINAWIRFDQERHDYRAEARRDHAAFGRGLAAAIEFVWERDGAPVALEAVEQFNQRESHLTIRWVWRKTEPGEREYVARRPALVPRSHEKTRSAVVRGPDDVPHMLTYAPVDVPGRAGALELYESLANEKEALRTMLARAAVTLAVLVVLCVVLTLGFGLLLVAWPLRALVAKAERIGAGDLSGPLSLGEGSELRELAQAMNTMCDRLLQARRRVQEEANARVRAVEQLHHADRLRTVGELASGIAHQLGTPLNVVRARGSMIARGEVSEARMRELGTVITEHVDRIAETIRQLLKFARREEANLARSDLVRTVHDTINLVEPLANQRSVRIVNGSELRSATLTMDAGQVHQALTNILMNAVHASPPGAEIGVQVRAEEARFAVEIRDAGSGIAAEHLPHIFEPFFTTKGAGDGTGLGLSVAEGIVRRHGGSIEVETSPQGTLFRVWLPTQVATRSPSEAPAAGA